MNTRFTDIVSSVTQLRSAIGEPRPAVVDACLRELDAHCRAFIAKCPFVLVASADAGGRFDISPKGDPPGFVHVLDDGTLAIPERPGNRRASTFVNVIANPRVGLLFLIPGKQETLRIGGSARIVRDRWLCEPMAVNGKAPDFALVVAVQYAYFHCAKCVIRSKLWQFEHWLALDGLPTLARTVVDHAKLHKTVEQVQAIIEEENRERLY
jgi:PPOX class probable FMN-dependent enzyme